MIEDVVIEAGPCTVIQTKTNDNDGYEAIQLGFDEIKEVRANPLLPADSEL